MSFFQHLLHFLNLPHVQATGAGEGRRGGGSWWRWRPRGGEDQGRARQWPGPGYLDMLSGEQTELPPVEMLVSMLSELSRLSVS